LNLKTINKRGDKMNTNKVEDYTENEKEREE